ncbi:MAG: hypothetical protein AVDCRST_MAG73-3089, partial [uncultured Thermomicrobiales bacterium]
ARLPRPRRATADLAAALDDQGGVRAPGRRRSGAGRHATLAEGDGIPGRSLGRRQRLDLQAGRVLAHDRHDPRRRDGDRSGDVRPALERRRGARARRRRDLPVARQPRLEPDLRLAERTRAGSGPLRPDQGDAQIERHRRAFGGRDAVAGSAAAGPVRLVPAGDGQPRCRRGDGDGSLV